jgi:hypothetical protein
MRVGTTGRFGGCRRQFAGGTGLRSHPVSELEVRPWRIPHRPGTTASPCRRQLVTLGGSGPRTRRRPAKAAACSGVLADLKAVGPEGVCRAADLLWVDPMGCPHRRWWSRCAGDDLNRGTILNNTTLSAGLPRGSPLLLVVDGPPGCCMSPCGHNCCRPRRRSRFEPGTGPASGRDWGLPQFGTISFALRNKVATTISGSNTSRSRPLARLSSDPGLGRRNRPPGWRSGTDSMIAISRW